MLAAMAQRCAKHGLVVASDGLCVICRREGAAPKPQPAAAPELEYTVDTPWLRWLAIGVVTLAVVAGVVWAWQSVPGPTSAPARPEALVPPQPFEVKVESDRPPERHESIDWDAEAGAQEVSVGQLSIVRPAPTVSADETASKERPPTDADLREALRAVQITMYSTSWCPHCDEARKWFTANRISFTEKDVEGNPEAREEQRRLNPRGGVPTIDIDGEVLVGFGPKYVGQAIANAAQRRLRER
jgi:glutaredoxin 3